jgi:hypothetical protein
MPACAATLKLPDEFMALCQEDGVTLETVLTGLCGIESWASAPRTDGYSNNGSDERCMARAYYERIGHPWWHRH